MVARIRGRNLLPLIDHLRARGRNPGALLRHFGLSTELFGEPEVWIPTALADRIWEFASEAYDDANLGLRVATSVDPATYGVLGYLATYSQNLQAALARIAKYHRTLAGLAKYRLEVTESHGRFHSLTQLPRIGRQMEEFCMGVVVSCIRQVCSAELVLQSVSFRSRPPPALDEHHAFFGHDLEFDAERTFIEFPRPMLQTPMERHDPQLVQILETVAEEHIQPANDSELSTRVRTHIAARLSTGQRVACEAVAAELGLSARSLRRHLSEQGQNFRAIHDEVIAGMADCLLLDPAVPLDEVVERLQFSNLRGLAGATQRWFGMTPQQYRRLTHTDSG